MGKTTTVHQILDELDKEEYLILELSLSQKNVSEDDILRQIARNIYLGLSDRVLGRNKKKFRWPRFIMGFLLLLFVISYSIDVSRFVNDLWLKIPLGLISLIFIISSFRSKSDLGRRKFNDLLTRLEDLNDRLFAQVAKESELQSTLKANSGFKKFDNLLEDYSSVFGYEFRFRNRTSKNFSVATAKEIEKEITLIINELACLKKEQPSLKIPSIICVIAELDKIEPDSHLVVTGEIKNQNISTHNFDHKLLIY